MTAYINGSACISHFNTADENFFFAGVPSAFAARFLTVTHPDYKNYIPANALRRTSAILKMGISSGLMALERAGIKIPDAIVTGTAMGCFDDTDKFLRSLISNEEKMLNPTPFIQSTHNTVAGQLALLTGCNGYNFTYVHQNLSFETALLDSLMLLEEKSAEHILTGASDELNPSLEALFEHAGYIRKAGETDKPVWEGGKGYVAGQGAVSFVLSAQKTSTSKARIIGVELLQKSSDLEKELRAFLNKHHLTIKEIQLMVSGRSGDEVFDKKIKDLESGCTGTKVYFKNLCGEYFTAGAFGTWLGAEILHKQHLPAAALQNDQNPSSFSNALVVNQFQDQHYSFVLLSKT